DAAPDVFMDDAVIVEHGLGCRYEVAVQHVHHVVGQVFFAVGGKVSDVGEKDGELKLLSFSSSYPMQLVEVQDNDILWIIKEPADNHGAVNPCLARQARELVPSPLVYNFLLDRVPGRDVRDPILDLDATGCAAPPAATLVEVWEPVPD